ncbi:MAG: hypothetical protein LBU15_00845 [Rickettsiales bacterium]|jgi:hypothetical protein|nr:hypothetical protein [Rickettsiales bacterium]
MAEQREEEAAVENSDPGASEGNARATDSSGGGGADGSNSKNSEGDGNSAGASLVDGVDFGSIDYRAFEEIDREHIDLYYELNDNRNNPEFLDEDLVNLSRKEEEMKVMNLREKEEFNFELEELIDNDRIKVDLTGIVDDKTEG